MEFINWLINITCTLVATSVILRGLECIIFLKSMMPTHFFYVFSKKSNQHLSNRNRSPQVILQTHPLILTLKVCAKFASFESNPRIRNQPKKQKTRARDDGVWLHYIEIVHRWYSIFVNPKNRLLHMLWPRSLDFLCSKVGASSCKLSEAGSWIIQLTFNGSLREITHGLSVLMKFQGQQVLVLIFLYGRYSIIIYLLVICYYFILFVWSQINQ